jgi:nicotinate dehydrogenase subunit B
VNQSISGKQPSPAASESRHASSAVLSRRELLKLLGGGILVWVAAPDALGAQERLPSAYIRIGGDGTITIFSAKVEYGQGVMTSLAQMAAEELDAPLSSMRVVMGDTALCPSDKDGGTYGSLSTRSFGPDLRAGAAKARAVLLELGAQQLGLAKAEVVTRDGYVLKASDLTVRVSYAALAGDKNVVVELTQAAVQKNYTQFNVSGKPVLRIDGMDKVTGQAKYTADVRVPGMRYASILRPPARAATLTSVDTSAAEAVAGARVIRTGSLIAVLHEQPDAAARALGLIKAEYNSPAATPNEESIYDYVLASAPSLPVTVLSQKGTIATGESLSVTRLEQTYSTPYIAHAPIEPHAALAVPDAGKITVYASTQTPNSALNEAGVARVITPYIGGAFGGKIYNQQAREAAQLARAAGVPVSLGWSREEEFLYDVFQCPSVVRIRSGLTAEGKISFWEYQVYWVGGRGATVLYETPHYRARSYGSYEGTKPFPGGAWRAPGANANVFARESHIDALAGAAGSDPVQFRLNHLQTTSSARLRKTLVAAAEAFGWQPASGPSGRGFGVACGDDAGAFVATMAEVAVDSKTGQVTVKRVLSAQDSGRIINPEGARMQMEGAMMMGLGYALTEEIHFNGTEVRDLNFNSYQLPRFSRLPKLETVLVPNDSLTPQGCGEPPIITMGAVLANAVYDATGVRMTRLPMTPDRVLASLKQQPDLTLNPPRLSGGQIHLGWKGGPGIRLQKSSTLEGSIWQDVPNTDGASAVSLPAAESSAFFRLFKF